MKTRIISLLLFLLNITVYGQDKINCSQGTKVSVTKEYIGLDVTPEEGKNRAHELARSEAINQVAGIIVIEETYRNVSETIKGNKSEDYFDTFSKLSRTTAQAKIVDEKVQYSTMIDAQGTPVYTVRLDGCVVKEKGSADPKFTVTLTMNNPVLLDRGDANKNDALQYSIEATQPCYIYLFNILANDSVQLLIPNKYVPNSFYDPQKKEQNYELQLRALNAKFIVQLPDGKSRSKEALYVVALRDDIPFPVINGEGFLEGVSAAYRDIMRWLVKISAERRTEAFQSYEIRKL